MQKPSKEEVLAYVAEMAQQLAAMCREHHEGLSAVLSGAAQIARMQEQPERSV